MNHFLSDITFGFIELLNSERFGLAFAWIFVKYAALNKFTLIQKIQKNLVFFYLKSIKIKIEDINIRLV